VADLPQDRDRIWPGGAGNRQVDDRLELAACGSSYRKMSTFAKWEYEVLQHCFEEVDFISLHQYFRNDDDDIGSFLAECDDLQSFITEVAAIADAVAATHRSKKKIMLSLDEWNVWYKAHTPSDLKKPGWPEAPPLLEEIYNFEDALVVGGALIVMMNNADRVKSACLAQLVNVLGAIRTETGGAAWRMSIFHPFAHATRFGRGEVLRARVDCGTYDTATHAGLPLLLTTVVHDPETGACTMFALNRSLTEEMAIEVQLRGMGQRTIDTALELHHADLKAVNTAERPDEVSPVPNCSARVDGETLRVTLKPLSWNIVATARSA